MAPQLMAMKGASARLLRLCTVRATTSLPVPLSPTISTLASVGAALTMERASSNAAGDLPRSFDDGIMLRSLVFTKNRNKSRLEPHYNA